MTDKEIMREWAKLHGKGTEGPSWGSIFEFARAIEQAARTPSAKAAGDRDAERFLTEEDMASLFTFVSQCEDCDADGYTVPKEQMKHLAEIGCVESKGFGRYSPTMFGDWLITTVFEQKPTLPLRTRAEWNEINRLAALKLKS